MLSTSQLQPLYPPTPSAIKDVASLQLARLGAPTLCDHERPRRGTTVVTVTPLNRLCTSGPQNLRDKLLRGVTVTTAVLRCPRTPLVVFPYEAAASHFI